MRFDIKLGHAECASCALPSWSVFFFFADQGVGEFISVKELFAFIQARYAIKLARDAGLPRQQWTKDPILARYKFTNVHREDDRVTRWLADHWRAKHAGDPNLWFPLTVFRRGLNWPETAEELGYPVPWNPKHYVEVCRDRRNRGLKVFESNAYKVIVPCALGRQLQPYSSDCAEQQVQCIFNPLWEQRRYYAPGPKDTLASFHARLAEADGMGSFQAAQVVADLKYAQLKRAADWWTFAASGPGSRRGLNRVLGRPVDAPWREDLWRAELARQQATLDPLIAAARIPRLHAQDLQNVLCEWDKRERVRLGEGKVREFEPYNGTS